MKSDPEMGTFFLHFKLHIFKTVNNEISLNVMITCCCFSIHLIHVYVYVFCLLFVIQLWPENGQARPKDVVNIYLINTILRQLCFDRPTLPLSYKKTQRGWWTWRFSYLIYFETNQLTVAFNPISMFLTEQLGKVQDFYDSRYALHIIRSLLTAAVLPSYTSVLRFTNLGHDTNFLELFNNVGPLNSTW